MKHAMGLRNISRILLVLCVQTVWAERKVVDEIRTVVYHEDGARIILASESTRPDLDGRQTTLLDAICEELILADAQRFHITVTPDDVERYLGELQKNNRMSRSGIEHAMEEMGYSYQEGMEKLRRRQVVEQMIDNRVRNDKRFMVTQEDVAAFSDANPVFDEAVYTLAEVVLDKEPVRDMTQAELDALPWEEPFEVKERDLAEEMQFLANAKVGDIVARDHIDGEWELTRLVAKKARRRLGLDDIIDPKNQKTLYDRIVDVLRMQRYDTLIEEYRANLLKDATLRFTYEQDREQVLGADAKSSNY